MSNNSDQREAYFNKEDDAKGYVVERGRAALALMLVLAAPPNARAGDAEAKGLLKAMSDYLDTQKTISFGYDSNLEVVTRDHQKLLLASSGKIEIGRPDKARVTRTGGWAHSDEVERSRPWNGLASWRWGGN